MKVYFYPLVSYIFYCQTSAVALSDIYTSAFTWREYNGSIPEGAIPGGRNESGYTYIGRVDYLGAVLVAEIDPATDTAYFVSPFGLSTASSFEILCGNPPTLWTWKTVNSGNFYNLLVCSYAIVGGITSDNDFYNIGRFNLENEIHVGGISSFDLNDPRLSFIHKSKVYHTTSYQVLVYQYDDFCPSTGAAPGSMY